jgi:hypothetical protein
MKQELGTLGNMLDKMAPLKEKDKRSRDILSKDDLKTR